MSINFALVPSGVSCLWVVKNVLKVYLLATYRRCSCLQEVSVNEGPTMSFFFFNLLLDSVVLMFTVYH